MQLKDGASIDCFTGSVLPVSGPFFRDIHGCQIQHFQKAVIRRKYRLAFGHFPELAVESFNEHMRSQSTFLILQFTSNISKIILPSILKMVKNQFAL